MARTALMFALLAMLPFGAHAQTSLNKCTDAQGRVTYSNLPCPKSRTTQKIEIDPAPPVPAAPSSTAEKSTRNGRSPAGASPQPETRRPTKQAGPHVSAKTCDALAAKLGRVLDKMDHARRHGYTLEEMNRWNAEVRELERKKQQSGCF